MLQEEITLLGLVNVPCNARACSIDVDSERLSIAILLGDCSVAVADFHRWTTPLKLLKASFRGTDKPALSVGLCLEQDTIVFGNADGIELHRKDFKSNPYGFHHIVQKHPADFVQFLPLRSGMGSTDHIRMIGSSKWLKPAELDPGDFRSRMRPIRLNDAPGSPQPEDRTVMLLDGTMNSLPLADGLHFLSMDASTELLCLSLPFLRLFYLVPPDSLSAYQTYDHDPDRKWGRKPPVTEIFAVSRDLRGTIRVAAAYGSTIILYSISGDAFRSSPANIKANCNEEWIDWRSEVGRFWDLPITRPGCLPYLQRGVLVGRLEAVQALAIEVYGEVSGEGGLIIWGFAQGNRVVAWKFTGRERACPMAAEVGHKKSILYKGKPCELRRRAAIVGSRK